MKTRLYKVYHIHVKGCNDLTDGYVGITKNSLSRRLQQHFCSPRPVGEILRKLGRDNVEIDQLFMLPKEEAMAEEFNLRPTLNIGWNILAGGNQSTVKCPTCGRHLPKRKTGSFCVDCHDTKFQKGHKPSNYGQGEKYKITSPAGDIHYPEAFSVFCKEHDLTPQNLRKVAKGKRQHHKGWKAVRLNA